eukprot:scaffold153_cov347-Pavlova_lutheri.AAC.43
MRRATFRRVVSSEGKAGSEREALTGTHPDRKGRPKGEPKTKADSEDQSGPTCISYVDDGWTSQVENRRATRRIEKRGNERSEWKFE